MNELAITSFKGKYAFLSNFYKVPVTVWGITFKTSEHAYQARKCLKPNDTASVINSSTPNKAKQLGRWAEKVADWEDIKISVMEEVVYAKFYQNPDLMKKLIETDGKELIEGNTWKDRFWGQCPVGNGENHLGRILMGVRANFLIEMTMTVANAR